MIIIVSKTIYKYDGGVYSRKLVVVIYNQWHIVASSVVRRHASELIPGFVTFVVELRVRA